jgi:DNA-binding transcriptional ArsR family regulator
MEVETTKTLTKEMSDRRMASPEPLEQPDLEDIQILDVLKALGDRTRLSIVLQLNTVAERACGTFPVDVAPSTLSHHFRILREAGIIKQREVGRTRLTSLRREELNERFPGLLESILKESAIELEKDSARPAALEPAMRG